MGFSAEFEKFLWEGIVFLAYLLIVGGLIQRRFSKTASLLAAGGTLAGIVLLQAGLLLSGQEATLVLTMLPLTAYLPATVCLHVLSGCGFFPTMAVWTIGAAACFVLNILRKMMIQILSRAVSLPGWERNLLITGLLILMAGLLVLLVWRFVRAPFREYVLTNRSNWLLLSFPAFMVFLLFSYFGSTTTDITLLALLLLSAVSIFLVLTRVLTSAAALARMKETERAVADQLQRQRREYEDICKKMEMGRVFRHDMRHHLQVLEGLAKQEDDESIARYIGNLNSRLSGIEKQTYCENPTVNAVLASYIGQAREADCSVQAKAALPHELPFDEMDVCTVLANTLENAVNACRELAGEDRYIRLATELVDGRRLTILVENPCKQEVPFDESGFPQGPKREGHGIGLKSVDAVVKKYNGMFHCEWEDGVFRLQAVLFSPRPADVSPSVSQKGNVSKKLVSSAMMVMLAFFVTVNCMPSLAQTMAGVPGLGALVRLADLRSYSFQWGDTSFEAVLPVLEAEGNTPAQEEPPDHSPSGQKAGGQTQPSSPGQAEEPDRTSTTQTSGGATAATTTATTPSASRPPLTQPSAQGKLETVNPPLVLIPSAPSSASSGTASTTRPTQDISNGLEDMNQQMEEYIAQMREKFLWYVARKYEGYVGMDITYEIGRNDSRLLSVRFDATLNVGGSAQYSRHFMLDKQTGRVMELSDLFIPGSDYVGVISGEILQQMTEQVQAGEGDYFIPGGIWSDDECFKEIESDQEFYINSQNQLVIVFEEYEVAPGSMGVPEFVIPTGVLGDILQLPSVIG